jgi:Na+/melibiose symporter-like transporter
VLWSGLGVGLYCLAMPILLTMIKDTVQLEGSGIAMIILGAIGILIIAGCIIRLRKSNVIASH